MARSESLARGSVAALLALAVTLGGIDRDAARVLAIERRPMTPGNVLQFNLDVATDCPYRFPCWAHDRWRLLPSDDVYRPKTLLVWQGQDQIYVNGTERAPLESDRPDFTEATSCVGLRRAQVEGGYTYLRDRNGGVLKSAHSFPETLLRVGVLTEWIEFRVGWNYGFNLMQNDIVSNVFEGSQDLYLGAKIALTEQDGWKPEMVLIPQMNVPTGHPALGDGEVEPGLNWCYAWWLNEWIELSASTQVNRQRDNAQVFYAEFAQSASFNYKLAERLFAYTETFAFFPAGAAVALPEYYFDGGFRHLLHNNLQLDIRAGVGLNDAADDFFGGMGAVVRF